MKILLQNNSASPIYEQIKQQIKEQILRGILPAGANLPSMRELAKDLSVSVITTKRAYEDLEKEGYLTSIRGKGTFVREQDTSILKEKQFIVIEELTQSLVKEAKTIGMSLSELQDIVKMLYEEEL
ncbi:MULTISPECIES: GntR family transcriptional regulator [unclassified Staphylococcus]|uniref:PSM export ABC transporter transcriptional regulator PmtR n=1 Tax=unclassified Staphylococcus TaxID=91994 RepID=UPI0021D3D41D|nr:MULTISPECIES: GntR family transcriptional regulator [unclassified Staphylococcus]UXR69054.1 GntR family transcriptional regulator [Staphylococcus sp. IVB6246]UXR71104.1 GntR family transcriptional regulator [Staphylococcus sp. IVB6240]UXR73397.1 GntR family transcriptional regulator [Staphylococcus sp. IVB6238]UXR75694.1 GntR family transcriptional regulator [Staphylococcus sp. IVB6233]UXR79892.1 GntR family transcriptional regulator [Staphylococcus sp. IVB6218]